MLLTTEERARELGLEPLAELVAYRNVGVQREFMGEGAFKVIPPLLQRAGVELPDVDFFEINEAFAAVSRRPSTTSPSFSGSAPTRGGAASRSATRSAAPAARQVVDMVHQLRRRDATVGVTSRCVGGGIGSAEVLRGR